MLDEKATFIALVRAEHTLGSWDSLGQIGKAVLAQAVPPAWMHQYCSLGWLQVRWARWAKQQGMGPSCNCIVALSSFPLTS